MNPRAIQVLGVDADRPPPRGWGTSALRRATLTLAFTQLVSWGVLFYGFAVVAPAITADTGWAPGAVFGAFSVGLLVAGLAAPVVASALATRDPRLVLTTGSVLGAAGMTLFAAAHHLVVLYAAWVVIGLAMAATLHEPAMAVVVALDPSRRQRSIATLTLTAGLASTAFAPLGGVLVDAFGWRLALVVLGVTGGALTALLHAAAMPNVPRVAAPFASAPRSLLRTDAARRLRGAFIFEQAAMLATTVHLMGLLVARGAGLAAAGAVLGTMGLGKVVGRLLLVRPIRRHSFAGLAARANVVLLVGLTVPLVTLDVRVLLAAATVVGMASGATTVLRPLLVVELVGAGRFAAVNARLHRATVLSRAAAPFALGAAAAAFGWPAAWALTLSGFAMAAERYSRLAGRCLTF